MTGVVTVLVHTWDLLKMLVLRFTELQGVSIFNNLPRGVDEQVFVHVTCTCVAFGYTT
jgi:hypothetical protein